MEVRLQGELRRVRLRSVAPPLTRLWHFDPEAFRELITLLFELQLTNFTPMRVYTPLKDSIEFWAISKRRV